MFNLHPVDLKFKKSIFELNNFELMASKFNQKSDGPQNAVKTTATDIGEFTITILVYSLMVKE